MIMKTKHTPGPWIVQRSILGELEPFGPDGRHLLSCEVADALPLKEREANGALMAAAPDLLQALLGCMKQIEAFDPGGCRESLPGGGRLAEAREAVAKTKQIASEA